MQRPPYARVSKRSPRPAAGAPARVASAGPRHGVARVISKRGLASRSEAARWVEAGRVRVNGRVVRDPAFPVRDGVDAVEVDGAAAAASARLVIALNKPRGLLTTASDERGRDTVYRCLEGAGLPWLGPVGRLDQASEGLLLLANDPAWAARITDPATGPRKTYHVQVRGLPVDPADAAALLARLRAGVEDRGEVLGAASLRELRRGERSAWLEVVLDEGRNRHIRRMCAAGGLEVLRLVRVAIGPLALGELAKGAWRRLSEDEIAALAG